MRVTTIRACVLAAMVAGAPGLRADTIELKDGRRFTGTVVTQGTRVVITTDDGATVETTTDKLASVKQVGGLTKDELAGAEWKRLAAAARTTPDLKTSIAMHERFLRQYGDTPSAEAAQRSLDNLRKLAAGGAVRYRGEWLSKEDFEAVRKAWKESAEPAAAFYKAGQLKEAQQSAAVLLAREPQNQEALAVAGMAAYRANSMPLAQRYFTLLSETVPASGQAHHNLAVLCVQKSDTTNALRHYTRALQIIPGNRLLLDNVTEFLRAYTEDKNHPTFKALQQSYDQAEAKMQGEMLKEKYYRWGSTWVTEEQLTKLTKAYDDVRAEMRALEAKYKSFQTMMPQIEEQIARARDDVRTHEAQVMAINGVRPGRVAPGPSGAAYAAQNTAFERSQALNNLQQAQSRLQALEARRNEMQGQVAAMKTTAEGLKSQLTQVEPQFTGIHRIMDLGEAENPPPFAAVNKKYEAILKK